MQEWEEKVLERQKAKEEGREELLKMQIQKKIAKDKDISTIADELEESEDVIQRLME